MERDSEVPFDLEFFLAQARTGRTIADYQKDQTIFSQGALADSIFYIERGKVKIAVRSEQNKDAIVAFLGGGHFCGEGCLGGQPLRMATAVALENCRIVRLEKDALIKLLREEPDFSGEFLSHIVKRNNRVEADLVDQLFNSTERRLARQLVLLARFGSEGENIRVIPKVSQETLAEMIGTTRVRVSFFMNKFRKMGLIDYKDRIEIHRSLLDVILHDDPHIGN